MLYIISDKKGEEILLLHSNIYSWNGGKGLLSGFLQHFAQENLFHSSPHPVYAIFKDYVKIYFDFFPT